jgi:hypothetical protein
MCRLMPLGLAMLFSNSINFAQQPETPNFVSLEDRTEAPSLLRPTGNLPTDFRGQNANWGLLFLDINVVSKRIQSKRVKVPAVLVRNFASLAEPASLASRLTMLSGHQQGFLITSSSRGTAGVG